MMFKSYTIARLLFSKPKRCRCCGVNVEKVQGYCEECLKIDAPEIEAIRETHLNESKGNHLLGKLFFVVTILILFAMVFYHL